MMVGGRIVHHLEQRLPSPQNTIVLGGYQAIGTRGRMIEDGAKFIRMYGREIPVRAAVEKVPGLSGHADRGDLLRWTAMLPQAPLRTFLTHGEPDAMEGFAGELRATRQWDVLTPAMGESVTLD
jgi:metallo-beta-lactamase family protein